MTRLRPVRIGTTLAAGLALTSAIGEGGGVAAAAPPPPSGALNTAVVRPGPAIKAAMASAQSGVFLMHRAHLGADGVVESLAILADGRVIDIVARRAGSALPRLASSLPKAFPADQLAQLLAFGIDRPLTDPAQQSAFQRIVRQGPSNAGFGGFPSASGMPARTLLFFDAGSDPFFARWGFSYDPGRSFGCQVEGQRILFALPR